VQTAQTLGLIWQKPVVGVNHLEGHILSPFIGHEIYASRDEHFPVVVLTVSGGHSMLVLMESVGKYRVLGSTIDDAAGDAFDKVGKMLGLPYPGGPHVDKLSAHGNPAAFDFPRPMMQRSHYDFSFSGLKTAVRYAIRDLKTENLSDQQKADVAASFQRAVVDCLAIKTLRAAEEFSAQTIFVAGGVGANRELRERVEADAKKYGIKTVLIDRRYSGDNAAMIAVAGYEQWKRQGEKEAPIEIEPKLRIGRVIPEAT
jgi:N6-L-threonylcarbamoyladenine synthase